MVGESIIYMLLIVGMKMIKMTNYEKSNKNQNPTRNMNLFAPDFIVYNPSVSSLPHGGKFVLLAGGLFIL
jgi:hypothetical protein